MTMIGRVIDGLPLAASMQSDQDVSLCTMHVKPHKFKSLFARSVFSYNRYL